MIKGIAHAAYTVKDMEKSVYFYCNALGFKKAFEINDDNGNPWIVYIKIKDGQFIELFYGGKERPSEFKGMVGYSHLCLEVDDIYETADMLRNNGITLNIEPKQGKDGNFQCWAKDPDGNRVEFMQMGKNSLQARS